MRPAALLFLFSLPALGAIQIIASAVRQIEDGPPALADTRFVAGETVYYSLEVVGYGTVPDKADRKVRLSYQIDALDPKGVKVTETVQSVLDTTISDQDKQWKPKIRTEVLLPPHAPGGKYKVVAKVTDDISKSSAVSETAFEVNGHPIEPSAELTVRNFGFYHSEDEPKPMPTAAYRPGDNLFARFDMTGFRYGDRNTIEVSYDVTVLTSEGKTLYTQPQAAIEKSFSFYPKPFVPGGMSLSLQPNMRKGEYTIVLTVHDAVGHQTYETKQPFQVQ